MTEADSRRSRREGAERSGAHPAGEASAGITEVVISGEETSAAVTRPAAKPDVRWAEPQPQRAGIGGSALSFGIAALCGSCFVGWLFPIAFIGIVMGVRAIRKPLESTALGVWGIGLSVLSLVYSGMWIWSAGTQLQWW